MPIPDVRGQAISRIVHRELLVLVALGAIAALTFAVTRAAAHANERQRQRDAHSWFEVAERDRAAGHLDDAVRALRRAVALRRDSTEYRLALADTLAQSGRADAAAVVLLGLRERRADDPLINLRLARLAGAGARTDDAVRYYQSALYGSWDVDATDARLDARREFVRYLLDQQQQGRALSELLILAANLPSDPDALVGLGDLFLRAGDPARALESFSRAATLTPHSEVARTGAGRAAFALGDYRRAARLLANAPARTDAAEQGAIAGFVVRLDPLAPRLSLAERVRRVAALLERAMSRAARCEADKRRRELQARAEVTQRQLGTTVRRGAVEEVEDALDVANALTSAADESCAAEGPLDRAILLIASRHESEQA